MIFPVQRLRLQHLWMLARPLAWALVASPMLSLSATSPVLANCPDSVGNFSYYEPAVGRLWEKLQTQTDYPWGSERPYGELNRDRITLTPEFDTLAGSEKDQVIDQLRLGYEEASLDEFLSPQERARSRSGTFPPYTVYTHDGRLLQSPYDGCTLMRTLTERDRYVWQYSRLPYDLETNRQVSPEALRNAGNPHWRTVRVSISPADELALRLSFWNAVGYDKAEQNWWIAWVPEQGHFEINVAEEYSPTDLEKFWQVADEQYSYIVLTDKGSFLSERLVEPNQ